MLAIETVNVESMAEAVATSGFLARSFTPKEIEEYLSKGNDNEWLAGIYAIKNAVIKAIRKANKIGLRDVEVSYDEDVRLRLTGKVEGMNGKIEADITWSNGYAVAIASSRRQRFAPPKLEGIPTITADDVMPIARQRDTHKGDYGRVYIIAGSPEMIGAGLLAHESALAALRSGCGLVTLCVARSLMGVYGGRVREEMLMPMNDNGEQLVCDRDALDIVMSRADSIVVGPGLGNNDHVGEILEYIMNNYDGTLVIDADGLNALSRDIGIVYGHKCKLILTPHEGEFDRLCSAAQVFGEHEAKVKRLALNLDAAVVCKSHYSYISDGVNIFVNKTGTAAMAKGGSGDVLAGMIGAFAARLTPIEALKYACYHFGKCGERAERKYGSDSVLASDIKID